MNVDLYDHLLLSFIVAYRAVPPNNTMRSQRTASAQLREVEWYAFSKEQAG